MIDRGLVNRRTVPRPPGVPVGCRRVVLGRGVDVGFRANTGRSVDPRWMSAFGGKADVIQGVTECPLIAKSGH